MDKFIIPEDYIGNSSEPHNGFASRKICSSRGWLLLVPGNSGMEFAKRVREEYETQLQARDSMFKNVPFEYSGNKRSEKGYLTNYFTDGELQTRLPNSVAGSDAYVIQNVHNMRFGQDVHANLFELFALGRNLRLNGAKHVTAVLPYLPYSRGDHPTFMERETATARLVADFIKEAGFDSVLTCHPHQDGLRAIYEPLHFTPIHGNDLVYSILHQYKDREDVAIVSPDLGASKPLRYMANALNLKLAVIDKFRDEHGQISSKGGLLTSLEGIVLAIMIDDETSSGSTLIQGGKLICKEEARLGTKIDKIGIVTHNKLKDKTALEELEKLGFIKFISTTTIPQKDEIINLPLYEQYSMAQRFAFAINHLFYGVSGSALFWPKASRPIFDDKPVQGPY